MSKNRDKFPNNEAEITRLTQMKWTMFTTLLVFGISCLFFGRDSWLTPFSEWVVTLIYVNFFSVLVFTSPYYDSIHPYGKMT